MTGRDRYYIRCYNTISGIKILQVARQRQGEQADWESPGAPELGADRAGCPRLQPPQPRVSAPGLEARIEVGVEAELLPLKS